MRHRPPLVLHRFDLPRRACRGERAVSFRVGVRQGLLQEERAVRLNRLRHGDRGVHVPRQAWFVNTGEGRGGAASHSAR